MIPLEQIKVASPCHADWDAMTGTEQVRFCSGCRKNVYNLSEMTREEAQALVLEKEGRLCVRFYTRTDGTMLTQDCPVGLRALRVKTAKKLSYAVALLLSCGTGLLRGTGTAQAVTPVKQPSIAPPHPAVSSPAAPSLPVQVNQAIKNLFTPPRPTMGAPRITPPMMGTSAPPPLRPLMGKPVIPSHTQGRIAQPHSRPLNPAVGPNPFAVPAHTMGEPTMGSVGVSASH